MGDIIDIMNHQLKRMGDFKNAQAKHGQTPGNRIPGERTDTPLLGNAWIEPRTGMKLIWIPGGSCRIGSPETEPGRDTDEGPMHAVTISGFYMAATPVTNAAYRKWKSDHCPEADFNDPLQPVVNISWPDARKYCTWLNRTSTDPGIAFGLPTETEWEYACRAGTRTRYSWGDAIDCDCANYGNAWLGSEDCKEKNPGKPTPAGSYPPNVWGLYDMHGNVWEWCADVYDHDFYTTPEASQPDPVCDMELKCYRVLRGGSWSDGPERLRSATRTCLLSSWRFDGGGFRFVMRPAPKVLQNADT